MEAMILADTNSSYEAGRVVGQVVGVVLGMGIIFFTLWAIVRAFKKRTAGAIVAAIIGGVLCLGLIVAGVGLGVQQFVRMMEEGNKIEQVLTSPDGRHSLTVPKSWKTNKSLNDDATIGAANLMKEQYAVAIIDKRGDVEMELPAFSKASADGVLATLTGGSVDVPKPLQISGMKALQRKIRGRIEGLDVVYLHTCVESSTSITQLLCWTLADREKTAMPILENVTLTFAEKGSTPALPTLPAIVTPKSDAPAQ